MGGLKRERERGRVVDCFLEGLHSERSYILVAENFVVLGCFPQGCASLPHPDIEAEPMFGQYKDLFFFNIRSF